MLRDYPVRALSYDPGSDEAKLEVGAPVGALRAVEALLLLDAEGFLVGVDLQGDELERAVVLVGPYERVDRTVPARVSVAFGADSEPAEVRVTGAKKAIRAADANPYRD